MNCVICNAHLTNAECEHTDPDGAYSDTCFHCLYGDSPGEDDSLLYEEWGNVWPDQ